eukprot:2691483-Pyramimonas_sp.AAC.1
MRTPRDAGGPRQPSRSRGTQKDKREEQDIKQFIGRVIPMSTSDAQWYMRECGYDVAPSDTQTIKEYKERAKSRLYGIACLVIVARKAGKDDTKLMKEVSCL